MIVYIIVIVLVVAAAGFMLIRKGSGPTDPRKQRELAFLKRPESFSLIVFDKNVGEGIPGMLESAQYKVLESTPIQGDFRELYEKMRTVEGPGNTIVRKGVYSILNRTVLIEPEMVLGSAEPEPIVSICKAYNANAIATVWERFSETVMISEFDGSGQKSLTCVIADEVQPGNINANQWILENPTPEGIVTFLEGEGIPAAQLFGTITGTEIKVDESSVLPGDQG